MNSFKEKKSRRNSGEKGEKNNSATVLDSRVQIIPQGTHKKTFMIKTNSKCI